MSGLNTNHKGKEHQAMSMYERSSKRNPRASK